MHRIQKKFLRTAAAVLCCVFLCSVFCPNVMALSYSTNSNYNGTVFHQRLVAVELTGDPRVDIVNVALSQYGYCESNSSKDLSGMNPGLDNYTEYGKWYGVQSLWCAMFASWCAAQAGISQDVIPSHAFTPAGVMWFMDRGQSYTRTQVEQGVYTPRAGDLVYFKSATNNNIVNHVAIVIGYYDGYVYTVEGNVNFDPTCTDGGQVLMRCRHISDTIFRYFCVPAYDSDTEHAVSTFFPAENEPSISEEVLLPENTGTTPTISQSAGAEGFSEKPQYSFIP